jgi:hypothetical protein
MTLGFPFLSLDHMTFFLPGKNSQATQAGLLTLGSIYLSRLPEDFSTVALNDVHPQLQRRARP